eukprot:CAMPEP_0203919750 /NCGR_PEP_ID=MMETSP0359-20131031/60123_1 /ASSEMBLY_ACC=CAM_ASM_000338 /TAXON_ID=268821 /ORGANISM="Scrippsiella Hangoei, Strain SHTV-5" /LENGTH=51 /DNA_ID=CAMNT_0050847113 /DNA_START=288 /DNA_END=444 /DNA_ORIENTATION=+
MYADAADVSDNVSPPLVLDGARGGSDPTQSSDATWSTLWSSSKLAQDPHTP